jgi:hypothetical protein
MGYNFRPYDQETQYLLPPSVADWVAEDSLARFVNDVVEHLDRQGRGDELPEGLRTKKERLERIAAAQKRLQEAEERARATQVQKIEQRAQEEAQTGRKKRGRKPKDPEAAVNKEAKANLSDPDRLRRAQSSRRIMKGRHGHMLTDYGRGPPTSNEAPRSNRSLDK